MYATLANAKPAVGLNRQFAARPWCGICKRGFTTPKAIQIHARKNSDTHKYFCQLCRRIFHDRNGLQNHVDNAPSHQFKCNLCLGAVFHRVDGLRVHLLNDYIHKYACVECLIAFDHEEDLWKHQEKVEHRGFTVGGHTHAHNGVVKHEVEPKKYEAMTFAPKKDENKHESIVSTSGRKPETILSATDQEHATCWLCKSGSYMGPFTPLKQIEHLEGGYCLSMQPADQLNTILASWWYSTLYMDTDVHKMLHSGDLKPDVLQRWKDNDVIKPFICRGPNCDLKFSTFGQLVKHVSGPNCNWDVEKLKLEEFGELVKKKASDGEVDGLFGEDKLSDVEWETSSGSEPTEDASE